MRLYIVDTPDIAYLVAEQLGRFARRGNMLVGEGQTVVWTYGALTELASPDEYNHHSPGGKDNFLWKDWRLEDLPMLPARFQLATISGKKDAAVQLKLISRLVQAPDLRLLVVASEASREGEQSWRDLLVHVGFKMRAGVDLKRCWINSLKADAIRRSLSELREPGDFDGLARAAKVRTRGDWLLGMNLTRALTMQARVKGHLVSEPLLVGRVKTPTLQLVALRQDLVESHVTQSVWGVVLKDAATGLELRRGGMRTRAEAAALVKRLSGQALVVVEFEDLPQESLAPRLPDLTELQREAARHLGYTAAKTERYLAHLYERRLITNPRSDSCLLDLEDLDEVGRLVSALGSRLGASSWSVVTSPRYFATAGQMQAAIRPLVADLPSDLGAEARQILDILQRRLLNAFMPSCSYRVMRMKCRCDGEEFHFTGRDLIKVGWKAMQPEYRNEMAGGVVLPAAGSWRQGEARRQQTRLEEIEVVTPRLLTEDILLEQMKQAQLGTSMTRAGIIEELHGAGYLERREHELAVTSTGRRFLSLLPGTWTKLGDLAARWERHLLAIEAGKEDPAIFMEAVTEEVRALVTAAERVRHPRPDEPRQEFLGDCPACHRGRIWRRDDLLLCCLCRLVIPTVTAKGPLPERALLELVHSGRTKEAHWFASKNGHVMHGILTIKDGRVSCEFNNAKKL